MCVCVLFKDLLSLYFWMFAFGDGTLFIFNSFLRVQVRNVIRETWSHDVKGKTSEQLMCCCSRKLTQLENLIPSHKEKKLTKASIVIHVLLYSASNPVFLLSSLFEKLFRWSLWKAKVYSVQPTRFQVFCNVLLKAWIPPFVLTPVGLVGQFAYTLAISPRIRKKTSLESRVRYKGLIL